MAKQIGKKSLYAWTVAFWEKEYSLIYATKEAREKALISIQARSKSDPDRDAKIQAMKNLLQ